MISPQPWALIEAQRTFSIQIDQSEKNRRQHIRAKSAIGTKRTSRELNDLTWSGSIGVSPSGPYVSPVLILK